MISSSHEQKIIDSWKQNAKPWIAAITHEEIESRKLITNKAIIDAILERQPLNVLDVGCGEGWLARELHGAGIEVHGIDIVPELVEEANRKGGGTFRVLSYEDLSQDPFAEKFDVIVCNFSLLGKESVDYVFQAVPHLLTANGAFIIQTIHPISGCGDAAYTDGWRAGSWAGFSSTFSNPAPWYFRTVETWKQLFHIHGMNLDSVVEPNFPGTQKIASIIFIGEIVRT